MIESISPYNDSPSDNPELADSVLETVDDLCKELGFVSFLFGGTCLGFVRDGIYTDDNDIDVTIVSSKEEYQNLWGRLAGLPGWSGIPGLRKGRIQLDLHYTNKELPYYVVPQWRPRTYAFREFDTVSYNGRSYNVPNPVEKYLEWEFGELWTVPMSGRAWGAIDRLLQKLLLKEEGVEVEEGDWG